MTWIEKEEKKHKKEYEERKDKLKKEVIKENGIEHWELLKDHGKKTAECIMGIMKKNSK